MKKNVIYQISRHKISKIEITNEEEEKAVIEANRDFERTDKRDKRYRQRNFSLEAMEEEVGFEKADDMPSPEENLLEAEHKSELRSQVDLALACLTEKQREVIILYFWEELSLREIARKKGIHHSSVEETFASAMKKLEKFFKKM